MHLRMQRTEWKYDRKPPKSYFECCQFHWSVVLANQEELHRHSFLLCASGGAGAMCEQGESPGQGTRGGKDFGALAHHLQQQPAAKHHQVRRDALKRICYLGFLWGRGEKRRWGGNNRALSQDKLIHHGLYGQRKHPSELVQFISHMETNYTAGISSSLKGAGLL